MTLKSRINYTIKFVSNPITIHTQSTLSFHCFHPNQLAKNGQPRPWQRKTFKPPLQCSANLLCEVSDWVYSLQSPGNFRLRLQTYIILPDQSHRQIRKVNMETRLFFFGKQHRLYKFQFFPHSRVCRKAECKLWASITFFFCASVWANVKNDFIRVTRNWKWKMTGLRLFFPIFLTNKLEAIRCFTTTILLKLLCYKMALIFITRWGAIFPQFWLLAFVRVRKNH